MEVPGQRKVLTTSSHLPASLMILLTTWPDSNHRSWLQGEAARTGQGCSPAGRGALGWVDGVALQKEGSKSGEIGAKGLWEPGGITRTHPGSRAEGLGRSLDRRELWVLPGHGRRGTDCMVPPAWTQRLHLSVTSHMTLSNFLKLVSLSVRWGS